MILAFIAVAAIAAAALAVTGGSTLVDSTGSRSGAGNVTVTTPTATAGTITGGVSPYTSLWQHVSGDTASPSNPNSKNTAFSRTTFVNSDDAVILSGVYRCRITDAVGTIVYGPNCTVETTHLAFGT